MYFFYSLHFYSLDRLSSYYIFPTICASASPNSFHMRPSSDVSVALVAYSDRSRQITKFGISKRKEESLKYKLHFSAIVINS